MGYNLLINRVYWGYNPFTNHLYTIFQRDIQVGCKLERFQIKKNGKREKKIKRSSRWTHRGSGKKPWQWKQNDMKTNGIGMLKNFQQFTKKKTQGVKCISLQDFFRLCFWKCVISIATLPVMYQRMRTVMISWLMLLQVYSLYSCAYKVRTRGGQKQTAQQWALAQHVLVMQISQVGPVLWQIRTAPFL